MIYLLRHGLDDERFVGGHSDVSLIDEGIKQIEESSLFIKKNLYINKIITSDVKRAVETSNIVKSYLGDIEVILDSNLRELDKGVLTGRLKTSLSDSEMEMLKTKDINFKFPDGESLQDMYDRVSILIQNKYFSDKDDYLIVTHRGVINMIYFYLNNIALDYNKKRFNVEHGSIHELDLNNNTIRRIY